MSYFFGGYFGGRNASRQREPDYMDVIKPYFEVHHVDAVDTTKENIFDVDENDEHSQSHKSLSTYQNEDTTSATTTANSNTQPDLSICVECEVPSLVYCPQCEDPFCDVCYKANHRSGRRTLHRPIPNENTTLSNEQLQELFGSRVQIDELYDKRGKVYSKNVVQETASNLLQDKGDLPLWWSSQGTALSNDWFLERSKYIPLRLTHQERQLLLLLQGVLKVSSYVNKVDLPDSMFKNRAGRHLKSIQEISAIFSALITSADYSKGISVLQSNDFTSNTSFLQNIFELGRRHKIRNPEKMRTSYGPLLALLQDAMLPQAREMIGFSLVRPVRTVYELLSSRGGIELLRDPLLAIATQEIMSHLLPKEEVQRLIKRKEQALKDLIAKHSTDELSPQTIYLAVYSIGDNHNFLRMNRDPCNDLLQYLTKFFHPTEYTRKRDNTDATDTTDTTDGDNEAEIEDPDYCLSIQEGQDGARLSHSHSTQYLYVLQSLSLWRDILDNFFKLWVLAEDDLLDVGKESYILKNTGQGYNRLQRAPRTDRAMREIIGNAQGKSMAWVGSSVVHLGDDNVPNAYFFIDKYNQVGKILGPVTVCLRSIEKLLKNPKTHRYIVSTYGSVEGAQRAILCDLFKKGFDGSGGDNFMDQGSCIDGRMTSLGQWRNDLPKKSFYPLFQLTGTVEMDGTDWDN